MARYDESDELRDIAIDIYHKNYGRSFWNRDSFDKALEESGRGTYLTDDEKNWLYDNYGNYNMSYYEEQISKREEEKRAKYEAERKREEKIRERKEEELRAELADLEHEPSEEMLKLKEEEDARYYARLYQRILKEMKYSVLEAKTFSERTNVDLFDQQVNSPEFQDFYEKTTGNKFVPVEDVIEERPTQFISSTDEFFSHNITTWHQAIELEKRINPEKRKEAFERYRIYFEDGSFNYYKECQKNPEWEQRGIEEYRKKNGYTKSKVEKRVPITPFEVAQRYFHERIRWRTDFSTYTFEYGDVKEFTELYGMSLHKSKISEILYMAKDMRSSSYQKLIQGINLAMLKAKNNTRRYLSWKYAELYFVRLLAIIAVFLNLWHVILLFSNFMGHPFLAICGAASNLSGMILLWFVFSKKYDLLNNLNIGFNPYVELRKKTMRILQIIVPLPMILDLYLFNWEVNAKKVLLFFIIYRMVLFGYYYRVCYKNPIKGNYKAKSIMVLFCTIAFVLTHAVSLLLLTGKWSSVRFIKDYYIGAFYDGSFWNILSVLISASAGVYVVYKLCEDFEIFIAPKSPLDVKNNYGEILYPYQERILADVRKKPAIIVGILGLVSLLAIFSIVLVPKISEMKETYQEKKILEAENEKQEEYVEQQSLEQNLEDWEQEELLTEEVEQKTENVLDYVNSKVMMNSIYCDRMAEFGYAITFELANIEEMRKLSMEAGYVYANMDYLNTNNEFAYGDKICLNSNENNYDTLTILLREIGDIAHDDDYIVKVYYSLEETATGNKIVGPEETFRIDTDEWYDSYEEYLEGKAEVSYEASLGTVPIISQIIASSHLEENGTIYAPGLALDGDLTTAWVEGVNGCGIGETLALTLQEESVVNGFAINAGYQKSDSLYEKNARPKTLLFTFSDGTTESVTLEDVCYIQEYTFGSARNIDSLSITIESVYEGSKYEDMAISEIVLK